MCAKNEVEYCNKCGKYKGEFVVLAEDLSYMQCKKCKYKGYLQVGKTLKQSKSKK